MTLSPAASGRGIVFVRRDLDAEIPALYDRVGDTRLGTVLTSNGATAGVVEHVMAALAGAGIDDAEVGINGPEPPILDGDARSYGLLIAAAGLHGHAGERRAVRIRRPVRVEKADASAELRPYDGRRFEFEILFNTAVIGAQRYCFEFTPERFAEEIAPARTFGFVSDLEALLKLGLSRGASLANTLAIDGDSLANPELQRFADEFVRHKILDAIGDLALAGGPVIGGFHGVRSSHALNNALLREVFADPANYEWISL